MSTLSYRNPQTGERITSGDSDALRHQGWQPWDQEADDEGRFTDFAAVRRANARAGHLWFDPSHQPRIVSELISGRYWIEARTNFDGTTDEYLAVSISPAGHIQYAHGAERFVDQAAARAIINQIVN